MKLYRKSKSLQKHESGQIVVIMALMSIGLIAIIGLAIDLGYMFVSYSHLRMAVDAAALATTSQFREGYSTDNLIKEAEQFLALNEITDPVDVRIETCETNPGDGDLCTTPARKLVRVQVTETVPLFFMGVVGIHDVPITVNAISEAASVDLVLLIDTSTSMALNSGAYVDPEQCNQPTADPSGTDDLGDSSNSNPLHLTFPGECHPFEEIKKAAILLTRRLFLAHDGNAGYDRVSIVTFDRYPMVQLELTDDQSQIEDTIRNLSVYQPERCPWPYEMLATSWVPQSDLFDGPCRMFYGSGAYFDIWSAKLDQSPPDPRDSNITNSGGGLKVAGNVLGGAYPAGFPGTLPPSRTTALWVVVWLTDGYTNAGFTADGDNYIETVANQGQAICPLNTWGPIAPNNLTRYCVDQDARPTVAQLNANPPNAAALAARHLSTDLENYDTDDYARDMVDFVTNPDTDPVRPGQGALLFTIGLGSKILDRNQNEIDNGFPPLGQTLLQYGAEKGGGIYYAAPDADQLNTIFLAIANKIATRLSR